MGVPKAFARGATAPRGTGSRGASAGGGGWVDVLRDVPLFEGVSDRHLRKIAGLGTIAAHGPGSTIVRKGDDGDACYVLLEGRADVVLGRGRPGAPMQPGAVFGEMALLDGAPRSASIVAVTDVVLFRLGRAKFAKLLRSEPSVALALLKTLAARLRAIQGA